MPDREDREIDVLSDEPTHSGRIFQVARSGVTGFFYVGHEFIGSPKDARKVAIAILSLLEDDER